MTESSSGLVVAVVDDDQSVLQSLEYLLESADHTVRLFASGADLLARGNLQEIDCLISDVDMPGMEGFELMRRVRTLRPGLPVILITGYPDTLKRLPAADGGNTRCFTKPFSGPELLAAVGESLRKSRA